jgi:beta-glucosidase-like glycosyl hydrolase
MVVAPVSRQREVSAALTAAVDTGAISTERLDASVRRILTLKERYGLLD